MMLDNNDSNDINNDSNPVQRENSKGNVELTTHKKTIKYDSEGARKIICRYGSGCTHSMDPTHKDKFWHPSLPKLNDEQIKSQFICNECGYGTSSLLDLQMHLKRKTAWSNASLVGCRISCLVDYKEWHEGVVTQFHKSGKHFVEFRVVNEKRWLLMKKIAFYIIERSPSSLSAGVSGSGEFKESSTDTIEDYLAEEDSWVYSEDLSVDYAFAQSVLFKIYGNAVQETGHLTRGHVCLTEADRMHAQFVKVSLLYGELLPRGTNKAFGPRRLDVGEADVLFDLGMGTGKIVVQAFLQFKNLKYVYGVELSVGRYKIAEESVLKMVALLGADNYQIECSPGKHIIVTEGVRGGDRGAFSESGSVDGSSRGGSQRSEEECGERILHLECGNMFDVANIEMADVVMMETDVPPDLHADLYKLLYCMREGARLLSYLDLRRIWEGQLAFRQLESNRHLSDRYPTSWSVQRGHHFYFWVKMHVSSDTISCHSATSHHGDFSATSGLHSGSVLSSSAHGTSLQQQQQQRQILNYTTLGTSESSNAPQSSSGANYRGVDCVEDDDSSHQPADSHCLPSFFSMFSWVGRSRKTDSSSAVVSSKPKDTAEPSNSVTAVKKPIVYKRSPPQISDRSVIPMQQSGPAPTTGAVRGAKSSEMGSSRLRFDPSSEASLSDDEVEPSPNVSSKSSSNRNRSVPVGGQHSQGQVQQQKRSEKLSSSIHHPSADFYGDGAVLSFPSFGDHIPEQANDAGASNTLSVVTGRLNHNVNKGASSTADHWGGRTDYTGLLDGTDTSKGTGVLHFASDDATPLCVECSEGEDQELDPQPYALGQEYAPETFVAVRGAAGLRTPPRDPQEVNSASPALALSFLTAPSPLGATPSDSSKKQKGRSQKKTSDNLSPHLLLASVAGDMSLIAEDAMQERCGESCSSLSTGPINA